MTKTTIIAAAGLLPALLFANDIDRDPVVRGWTLLGPLPSAKIEPVPPAGQPLRDGWATDYLEPLGGEQEAEFAPGDVLEHNGQTYTAIAAQSNNPWGGVDLNAAFGEGGSEFHHSIAYARATVMSGQAARKLLVFGTDDAAKIWFNGELVYDHWVKGRAMNPREFYVPIGLQKGENTILLKVEQNSGPWGFAVEVLEPEVKDDLEEGHLMGPAQFPKFEFAGHEEEAELLGRYLWHFFSKRVGHFYTAFVLDYMMTADIWLGGAELLTASDSMSIQQRKRFDLDSVWVDDDGYVQTHQHFSHAHDGGWPFPLYMQEIGDFRGKTYGWHWGGPQLGVLYQLFAHNIEDDPRFGEKAIEGWELVNATSDGIVDNAWQIRATGESPMLITPEERTFDAFQNPFMQLRWRSDNLPYDQPAYFEWKREGDEDWSAERRAMIYPQETYFSDKTGMWHSHIRLYDHPHWEGTINRIRLSLAPGEDKATIRLIDFFSVYDTRKPYNNLHFILASWNYFRWTGDLRYLFERLSDVRKAFHYIRHELHVDEAGVARVTWPGHDGLPGWNLLEDGTKAGAPGHGIGNNYYDIVPFGYDDMYLTTKYYATVLAMAELEEAIAAHPEWRLWRGSPPLDPHALRAHAAAVKRNANETFWDAEKGRYVACIDANGKAWDFGYTFLPLEAIWFGIAEEDKARTAMDWISGRRIVEGDTSQGDDIYYFRFGPRVSTLRNIEWYSQGWTLPESLEFGQQIQDGGAVLGFTFYDLYARLKIYGPDNAWQRLEEILQWQAEVNEVGTYREYYAKLGIQMQGGGTAGGIGIDVEFLESALPPSIVPYGFLGLDAQPDSLRINPTLPSTVPQMTLRNFRYHGNRMDVTASPKRIAVTLHEEPLSPVVLRLPEGFSPLGNGGFQLLKPGTYQFDSTRGTGSDVQP